MIGKKIKEYRQLLKVTGTVLANLAGIKQSYLSQIENERKVPPLDTFINLVTAPNITTWDTSKFENWLNNVSSSGVVRKPAALTIPSGLSGVPTGWTTENY